MNEKKKTTNNTNRYESNGRYFDCERDAIDYAEATGHRYYDTQSENYDWRDEAGYWGTFG